MRTSTCLYAHLADSFFSGSAQGFGKLRLASVTAPADADSASGMSREACPGEGCRGSALPDRD